jgi:hypothetical protein
MKNTKFELFNRIEKMRDDDRNNLLSHIIRTERSDNDWNLVFIRFILSYYESVEDKKYYADKSEKVIKQSIQKHHINDYHEENFTLNFESSNNNAEQEGFYDLKFSHDDWDKNKYFVMEAKCLNNTAESIKQYIHCHKYLNKIKTEDGGVYRFLSLKYSKDLNFGGMIGFIQKGNSDEVIQKTKESLSMLKLKDANSEEEFGHNLDESLFSQKIEDFPNSFYSKHNRKLKKEPILLYHIFLDFTKQ